jgi:hypothetical protein
VLATGVAVSATGFLVSLMGAPAQSAGVQLVQAPPTIVRTAPSDATPPTTIVVIHRPAAGGSPAPAAGSAPAAAAVGRATPAARPAAAPTPAPPPAPVATSTAS